MIKTRKQAIVVLLAVGGLYLSGPIIAGIFHIGDREGPVFYSVGFHTSLYIIAAEGGPDGKPRSSPTWILYDRPLFYGMHRRPKSEKARQAILLKAQENQSPLLNDLKKWNSEIDGEQADGKPPVAPQTPR